MPPIEFDGARGLQPVRKVALTSVQPVSTSVRSDGAVNHKPAQDGPMIEATRLAETAPRADADRVAQIRKAVENGSYPLVPARIADAMIAAEMFLRKGS